MYNLLDTEKTKLLILYKCMIVSLNGLRSPRSVVSILADSGLNIAPLLRRICNMLLKRPRPGKKIASGLCICAELSVPQVIEEGVVDGVLREVFVVDGEDELIVAT